MENFHASLAGEGIFEIAGFTITNSLFTTWIVMAVLLILAWAGTRNIALVPGGLQNLWEAILEFLLGLCTGTAPAYARTIFPLFATLFIFIVTANWMGLLPGVNSITIQPPEAHAAHSLSDLVPTAHAAPLDAPAAAEEGGHAVPIPLFRAANADMNTTLAMAVIAFIMIHASGIRIHGVLGYAKEIATPIFLTPVKVVIECFVPVSLSFRLFGNVFGGEMLLTVMAFPVVAVLFMLLEILFGLIQAVIFSMLTLVFTALAVTVPEGHGHGDSAHDEHDGAEEAAAAH